MAVLYKNGVMVTMNGDQTAETLIEKDGRIAMVGSLAQARIWQKAHPQEKLDVYKRQGQTSEKKVSRQVDVVNETRYSERTGRKHE